jgi:DNA-binding response OmpR family regulator
LKKILIIEDEDKLLATLVYLLLYAGYQVVQAKDGLEGLEKVQQEKPNLILCDIMMPRLNGIEFLKRHQQSCYASIPVVLMSARSSLDDYAGLDVGSITYIRKPFRFVDLHTVINSKLLIK